MAAATLAGSPSPAAARVVSAPLPSRPVLTATSGTTSGTTSGATSDAEPTIVVEQGAFADASGWSAEVRMLQRKGYPVIAPADPLRALTSDSDYLRAILATIEGPVVLVVHSYGGAVITNAARGASNVVAFVYVAAFVPDVGTSVATSYDPTALSGLPAEPSGFRGASGARCRRAGWAGRRPEHQAGAVPRGLRR